MRVKLRGWEDIKGRSKLPQFIKRHFLKHVYSWLTLERAEDNHLRVVFWAKDGVLPFLVRIVDVIEFECDKDVIDEILKLNGGRNV